MFTKTGIWSCALACLFYSSLLASVMADFQAPVMGDPANVLSSLEMNIELSSPEGPNIGPDMRKLHNLSDDESPPFTHNHQKRVVGSGGTYWLSQIKRQGKIAYGSNASYVLWRNVRDYGAKGDGVTDDLYAINNATADGNRCGLGCDSSTTLPAIVYFPPGTYMVSAPLVQYYYTQFIGDANNLPTIMALPNFFGIGLFDSDVYLPYGATWYTNQNNFYRQIRNFILDITLMPATGGGHCIHWQVAQATSLQNIVFNMIQGTMGDGNTQIGIFMDNGSGGMMEDLIFYGGGVGFFSGNQQFTARNMTFIGCETAIFQNWNWVFLYKSITIKDCGIGMDLTQGGDFPAVGSTIVQDSLFINNQYGIVTSFSGNSTPTAAGTLVLDNVNFVNTDPAVQYPNNTVIVPGNQIVGNFVQGRAYTAYETDYYENGLHCYGPAANSSRTQRTTDRPPIPDSLLDDNGNVFERRKPQYEGVPFEDFKSIIDFGCVGDGLTDDTTCLQDFLDSIGVDEIAYFDHGAYLISNTIDLPINIKIVGEIWPIIMVDGSSLVFQNEFDPTPAIRVGHPGDVGTVEITDMVFETRGPSPGCIVMEWNLAGTDKGTTGMWDTHFRIGGTAGTLLQSDRCTKTPNVAHGVNTTCIASFLLMHITTSAANMIMANNWGWVSDHELDLPDHNQIDIYNGRGLLVESQGPIWIYGSSFEHSVLYNYNFANAKEIYASHIQSETAYMQNNPNSLTPFTPQTSWSDPTFSECYIAVCYKTMAVRIVNSTYIFNYGAGLYSFFNNYDQGCLLTEACQQFMVQVEQSEAIYMYALNTKAATTMVEIDGVSIVPQVANANSFCQCVAVFEYP